MSVDPNAVSVDGLNFDGEEGEDETVEEESQTQTQSRRWSDDSRIGLSPSKGLKKKKSKADAVLGSQSFETDDGEETDNDSGTRRFTIRKVEKRVTASEMESMKSTSPSSSPKSSSSKYGSGKVSWKRWLKMKLASSSSSTSSSTVPDSDERSSYVAYFELEFSCLDESNPFSFSEEMVVGTLEEIFTQQEPREGSFVTIKETTQRFGAILPGGSVLCAINNVTITCLKLNLVQALIRAVLQRDTFTLTFCVDLENVIQVPQPLPSQMAQAHELLTRSCMLFLETNAYGQWDSFLESFEIGQRQAKYLATLQLALATLFSFRGRDHPLSLEKIFSGKLAFHIQAVISIFCMSFARAQVHHQPFHEQEWFWVPTEAHDMVLAATQDVVADQKTVNAALNMVLRDSANGPLAGSMLAYIARLSSFAQEEHKAKDVPLHFCCVLAPHVMESSDPKFLMRLVQVFVETFQLSGADSTAEWQACSLLARKVLDKLEDNDACEELFSLHKPYEMMRGSMAWATKKKGFSRCDVLIAASDVERLVSRVKEQREYTSAMLPQDLKPEHLGESAWETLFLSFSLYSILTRLREPIIPSFLHEDLHMCALSLSRDQTTLNYALSRLLLSVEPDDRRMVLGDLCKLWYRFATLSGKHEKDFGEAVDWLAHWFLIEAFSRSEPSVENLVHLQQDSAALCRSIQALIEYSFYFFSGNKDCASLSSAHPPRRSTKRMSGSFSDLHKQFGS